MASGSNLTQLELTPVPKQKCWKKFRRGTVFYVGKGNALDWTRANAGTSPQSDAYQAALREWRTLAAQLELDEARGVDTNAPDYKRFLKAWRRGNLSLANSFQRNTPKFHEDNLPEECTLVEVLDMLGAGTDFLGSPAPATSHPLDLDICPKMFTCIPLSSYETSKPGILTKNVDELIVQYLNENRRKAEAGQFSNKHYAEILDKLSYFKGYCKHFKIDSIEKLDANQMKDFYARECKRLNYCDVKERASVTTIRKRLVVVKNWLLWCEESGALSGLPAYVMKSFCKVTRPRNTIAGYKTDVNPVFTIPEIKTLLSLATEQTKLYLLLGLNCGFTQIDLASLHWDHYDPDTGIIDRPRHKTEHRATNDSGKPSPGYVRQVFQLWPETQKLLLKLAQPRDSGLMLLTRDGKELATSVIKKDGSVAVTDSVRLAFNRLRKQWAKSVLSCHTEHSYLFASHKTHAEERNALILDWLRKEKRGFKSLRKTSANLLEQSTQFADLASLFLAQSEKATKKFYVNPPYEKLTPALEYLREKYGLTT